MTENGRFGSTCEVTNLLIYFVPLIRAVNTEMEHPYLEAIRIGWLDRLLEPGYKRKS